MRVLGAELGLWKTEVKPGPSKGGSRAYSQWPGTRAALSPEMRFCRYCGVCHHLTQVLVAGWVLGKTHKPDLVQVLVSERKEFPTEETPSPRNRGDRVQRRDPQHSCGPSSTPGSRLRPSDTPKESVSSSCKDTVTARVTGL